MSRPSVFSICEAALIFSICLHEGALQPDHSMKLRVGYSCVGRARNESRLLRKAGTLGRWDAGRHSVVRPAEKQSWRQQEQEQEHAPERNQEHEHSSSTRQEWREAGTFGVASLQGYTGGVACALYAPASLRSLRPCKPATSTPLQAAPSTPLQACAVQASLPAPAMPCASTCTQKSNFLA